MKKTLLALLTILVLSVSLLAGCGSSSDSSDSGDSADASETTAASDELEPLVVGASVTPHAEILSVVKDVLAEEGYDLQIVEYSDYVLPNTALEDGDLDANYFQHQPYLDNFNEENGTSIVSVASIHFEPLEIYAGQTSSLDDLEEGATVAVPNDTTNEARALLLLQQEGLITLSADAGLEATVLDIEDNPLNLQIEELEAAQVARAIEDVDIAVVNGNYANEAELDAPIATEDTDSEAATTYANVIAVREGEENTEKTQALVNALLSDEVRDFINNSYNGTVLPVF